MNVFEFLGLPKDHRKTSKVVQLVKHFDEVPDSVKLWPVYGQVKKDGVYCLVVINSGNYGLFSRTGKRFTNVDILRYGLVGQPMQDGVYITELCCDFTSLEALSGVVNPNRKTPLTLEQKDIAYDMYLQWHDYLTIQEFIHGESKQGYISRYTDLIDTLPSRYLKDLLRVTLPALNTPEEVQAFADLHIKKGEEGAVFKPDVGWLAGHKGKNMMKKVRGVSYDLECIGYEEGKGKYTGKVANLLFRWKNGKTVKAMLGKGWTHEDAEIMFHHIKSGSAGDPHGCIYKVYALQESSKGVLRLPKVGELRHDKTEADY